MSWNNLLDALRALAGGNPLLARLLFASIEVTVLALAVAVLIRLARIRSPRLVSLLWLVVLIKPIVSLAVGSPVAIACLQQAKSEDRVAVPAIEEPAAVAAEQPELGWGLPHRIDTSSPVEPSRSFQTPAAEPVDVGDLASSGEVAGEWISTGILAAWLAIVAVFLGRYFYGRWKLHRLVAASSAPASSVTVAYRRITSQLGLRRLPRLVVTEALDSPALAGVFRPVILVPSWLADRGDCPELVWSLRHELTHWRWRDPAAIAVRDLATTLFAFHPVVLWAGRRQTEALELACDQAVIQGEAEAADYAERLYQILKNIHHRRRAAVAGGLFATRTQIGKRIAALLDGSHLSARRLGVFSVAGVLLLAFGALAVGGAVRDQDDQEDPAAQDAPAKAQEPSAGGYHELRFPTDYSLGALSISGPRSLEQFGTGWTPIGAARGTVRLPRDKLVRLVVSKSGVGHLADLRQLKPDDLHMLALRSDALDSPQGRRVDLSPIEHLTGLRSLDLMSKFRGDEIWAPVAKLKSLEGVYVVCPKMTDRALKHLAELESLRRLIFRNSPGLTDAGLAHLRNAKGLEILTLIGSPGVTDAGLAHLRNAKGLKELTLVQTGVTGRGLASLRCTDSLRRFCMEAGSRARINLSGLARMKSLRVVGISYSRLEPSDMATLGKLPALETLSLYGADFDNASFAHLASLRLLNELTLKETGVGDAEMRVLAEAAFAKSLKKLRVERTAVTDAGLRHIGRLSALEYLKLPRGTTDAGLARLRRLKQLKTLDIQSLRMKGTGLGALAGLKSLTVLKLPSRGVSDSDLAALAQLGQLEELVVQGGLKGPGLTESGLAHLSHLGSLHRLVLGQAEITDKGLAALKDLPLKRMMLLQCRPKGRGFARLSELSQLEELDFLATPLRPEDLAGIGKLSKLKDLRIRHSNSLDDQAMVHLAGAHCLEFLILGFPVTDAGLVHLKDLKRLTTLGITGDITAEGLVHLEGLPSLRDLSIESSRDISGASLRRLRRTLPALESFHFTHRRAPRAKIGHTAPRFSFTTLDGKQGRLANFRGKVVLLHFWSTSCAPCMASMPALKRSYEAEHKEHDDFVMLSLCAGHDELAFRRVVEKNKLTWPQIYLDMKSELAANYGATSFPTYILVNRGGKIAYHENNDRKLNDALIKAYEQPSNKPKGKKGDRHPSGPRSETGVSERGKPSDQGKRVDSRQIWRR